ncbi:MAG: hypothetical protein FJY21_03285 [Bacteroidetes bacterium]|nr:hypothetical protein [Bacteroidota bacterium]
MIIHLIDICILNVHSTSGRLQNILFYGFHDTPDTNDLIFESNTRVLSFGSVLSSGVFPARNGI